MDVINKPPGYKPPKFRWLLLEWSSLIFVVIILSIMVSGGFDIMQDKVVEIMKK
jgi:hypothetical protein